MKKAITINVREYRKAIKNGKPRETGNIGYTRRIQYNTIQHNICWTPLWASKHN